MRLRKDYTLRVLLAGCVLGSTTAAFAYTPGRSEGPTARVDARRGGEKAYNSLPPLPHGRRTVLGGRIYNVDPVNDQFWLKIPGGQKVPILYDERTHLYQDGDAASIIDLHAAKHASIETTLDGSKIFAVSIHLLTKALEGEIRGKVLSYSPGDGTLKVTPYLSHNSLIFTVPPQTAIIAIGQIASPTASGELMPGSLVNVKFRSGNKGRGVATHITLLAYPGAHFIFQGKVSFLNLQAGRLTIQNVADNRRYQMSFTPQQLAGENNLHEGSNVKVVADFTDTGYIAESVTAE